MKTYFGKIRIPICGENRCCFMFWEKFTQKYNFPYINKCCEESPISKEEYYGIYANDIKDVNNCLEYKHHLARDRRGCYYCDYHGKCSEFCWTQVLFDKYELSTCPIKRIYQYIEDNPSIIDRYKSWEDKYE